MAQGKERGRVVWTDLKVKDADGDMALVGE
jgi:hypothetical protein